MGDRANVVFTFGQSLTVGQGLDKLLAGNIVLYSHWGGSDLAVSLQAALAKARPRWGDIGYATRIVVCALIGKAGDGETGYGLYVGELCANEHNLLIVDWMTEQVVCVDEQGVRLGCVSFKEYLGMSAREVAQFHEPHTEDA